MVSGGHNAKSTHQLKLAGTFRRDRHGHRVDDQYDGVPEPVRGLGKEGQFLWSLVTTSTPEGILAKIDGAALFAMCRWWSVYRTIDRRIGTKNEKPNDIHSAVCAWKQCSQLMSQFGLTPVARTRLKGGSKPDEPIDALSQMIRNRKNAKNHES